MQTSLTIVILTYNSQKVIKNCLENINLDKYLVIVADNASSDDTLQIVEQNFPQVKIIKLDKNYGYGRGNNFALKLVESEFALVLNPDAFIKDEDIELVLNAMRQDKKAALAGCINLKNQIFDEAQYQKELSQAKEDFQNERSVFYEKTNENYYANFIVGAGLFMKMSIMKTVGFFDKNIFLYYEDNEICKRTIDAGYKNLIVTKAIIMHVGSGSTNYNSRLHYKVSWHMAWSKLYFRAIKKGYSKAKRLAFRNFFRFFFKAIFSIFNKKKFILNLATSMGSLSYFLGLKAFDKNDKARG